MGPLPGPTLRSAWLNAGLFVLTVLSTIGVGLSLSLPYVFADVLRRPGVAELGWDVKAFLDPRVIALALLYSGVLMAILTAHELGHYLMCRRYGLAATLPFFIPAPNLFGTFGAFIKIKSPISWKRQLFDVGVAGPLAGALLAFPALLVGLAFSKIVIGQAPDTMSLGEPLLLKLGGLVFLRRLPEGANVILHPVAFAGWVGLLVTSINLFPVGQLDGGHIAYALVGRKRKLVSSLALSAFLVLGVFFFAGWLIWGIPGLLFGLVLRLKRPAYLYRLASRLRHPPVLDEDIPLDRRRVVLAAVIIIIFVLSFIPDPIKGTSLVTLLKSAGAGVK
jgi:membrane-associated protease RseP (regulator of RpoE activity)